MMLQPRRTTAGFTLLELLVTIGLMALLATLIIVALGPVRRLANRTDSSNALRQMAMGYRAYASDFDGQLMPGYADANMLARLRLKPRLPNGDLMVGATPTDPHDASSYVWRLAEYLDGAWQTMYVDYRNPELIEKLTQQVTSTSSNPNPIYGPGSDPTGGNDVSVALVPSFGLNSIFLGGDNVHGGGDVTSRNPWTPTDPRERLAATTLAQPTNPAQLIVFAPVAHQAELSGGSFVAQATITDIDYGYPELRAPKIPVAGDPDAFIDQWRFVANPNARDTLEFPGDFDTGGGIPFVRWGNDELPVAHLDGSVSTENLRQVAEDMTMWLPFSNVRFGIDE